VKVVAKGGHGARLGGAIYRVAAEFSIAGGSPLPLQLLSLWS
jgi:hypothetical protein